jgi:hypothetical protein
MEMSAALEANCGRERGHRLSRPIYLFICFHPPFHLAFPLWPHIPTSNQLAIGHFPFQFLSAEEIFEKLRNHSNLPLMNWSISNYLRKYLFILFPITGWRIF